MKQPPPLPRRLRGPSVYGWLNIGGVVLLLSAVYVSISMLREKPSSTKQAAAIYAISNVQDALKAYRAEYAAHPDGNEAQIMASLRGDNPKGIVFFDPTGRLFNDQGEFLDPWDMPYRIDVRYTDFPRVYSWGPNRTDDGEKGDDIGRLSSLPADPQLSPPKKRWLSRF